MNVPGWLQALAITPWSGTSNLWLDPTQEPATSDVEANIRLVANSRTASIEYSWSFEGQRHDGILIVGARDNSEAESSWFDTFHTGDAFMVSKGTVVEGANALNLMTSYAAPDGPDWGWRTIVEQVSDTAWRIRMLNIPPGVDEQPGFDLNFSAP